MGKDYPERLYSSCLTSIEDYRKMQIRLHAMKKNAMKKNAVKKNDEPGDRSGGSDEWKNWELAPLGAPVKQAEGQAEELSAEPSSEAVKGVHKALRAIDRY